MKFKQPSRIAEANIQAELYKQAKEAGLNNNHENKFQGSIFDVIIYDDDQIQCIIEVKSYKTSREPKLDTKQMKKYASFNVPLLIVTRMDDVKNIISDILRDRAVGSSDGS